MKRSMTILICVLAGLVVSGQAPNRADDKRGVETIAPGIELISINRGNFVEDSVGDRWTIKALLIDSKLARLRLGQAMDEIAGAEATSSMAERHGALAAVNGGYFRTTGIVRGEPVGVLTIGGKLLSEPVNNRAALAVGDDGKQIHLLIAYITIESELLVGGKTSRAINGFNRPRGKDELIVFTPEFHRTTLTAADGLEVLINDNRIAAINDNSGSRQIPQSGFVISAHGASREWAIRNLRQGARVQIKSAIKSEPPIGFKPDFVLGAGPQLVSNGKKVFAAEAGRYSESLYRLRHPRTAIGWRSDGKLILLTVDGRQKQSVGMTIDELANLMLEFGCAEAMNMDGGGSTTMVVKGKVVNHPSDATGERAVSDALLVFPR